MGKMQRDTTNTNTGRREFFRTAVVTVGAAAIIATGRAVAAPQDERATLVPKTGSQGYRVTDHIRDYYRVAGL